MKKRELGEARGTIGQVPKLAPGATNPMWAITDSVTQIARDVAPFLSEQKPKRYKTVNQSSIHGFWSRKIELPDEYEDIPEPLEEEKSP